MKQRIVAAWKVLRGEWVAKPPTTPTIYSPGGQTWTSSGTSGDYTVTWGMPAPTAAECEAVRRRWARAAGRRAVRKHADALRRLAS